MRSVLILGASSDIGKDIVVEYVERGWSVLAHGNSWSGDSDNILSQLPNVSKFRLDLSDVEEVHSFIESCNLIDKLDAVINCVGYWQKSDYNNLSIHDLERSFRINVYSPYFFVRSAVANMLSREWGRIVHLGSIGVKFGGGLNTFAYSWSKHAIEFMPSVCSQWVEKNVLINVARVGVTDTRMQKYDDEKDLTSRILNIPIGRMLTTSEIAKSVAWLGTEDNQIITGQVIHLSGGE